VAPKQKETKSLTYDRRHRSFESAPTKRQWLISELVEHSDQRIQPFSHFSLAAACTPHASLRFLSSSSFNSR